MNRALLAIAALAVLSAATGLSQPSTNNAISALMLSNGVAIPPVVTFGSLTNSTNVFQRAFGGEMEAGRVVDRSATNWWAVFNIIDPAGMANGGQPLYSDVTLKCTTNGQWHFSNIVPVFRYTTTDPALNGAPAWETFTTNWYPRVFYYLNHETYEMDWATQTRSIDPTRGDSIYDALLGWDGSDSSASYPHVWVIMVRDTGAWFSPTNFLHWHYTLHGQTVSPNVKSRDGTALGTVVWFPVVPMWVNYDPRPKKIQVMHSTGGSTYTITNQHQQP